MIDEGTAERVLQFIANAEQPAHSTEIAAKLGINRVTISKYLSVLHSRGLISFRNIGMAKVWDHVDNPILLAFEKGDSTNSTVSILEDLPDSVCVLDRKMQVVWANRAMRERHGGIDALKGRKCFEAFHGSKGACRNCAAAKTFKDGKSRVARVKSKGGLMDISVSPLKEPGGKVVAVIEIVRSAKRSEGKTIVPA